MAGPSGGWRRKVVVDQAPDQALPGPQAVTHQGGDIDVVDREGQLAAVADVETAHDHQALPGPQLDTGLGQLALQALPLGGGAERLQMGVPPVAAAPSFDELEPAVATALVEPGQLAGGPDLAPEVPDHGQAGPSVEVADGPDPRFAVELGGHSVEATEPGGRSGGRGAQCSDQ